MFSWVWPYVYILIQRGETLLLGVCLFILYLIYWGKVSQLHPQPTNLSLCPRDPLSASHILELQAATLLPNFYMGSGSELWSSWLHIKRSMNQAVSPAPKAASFRLLLQAWSSCTVWTSVPAPFLLTSDQIYSKWYLEGSAAPADEKEELQCSFISHPLNDHLLEIC